MQRSTDSINSSTKNQKKILTNKDYFKKVQEQIFFRKYGQARAVVFSSRENSNPRNLAAEEQKL